MRATWLVVFGLAACGRIGFDAENADVRTGLRYAFDLDELHDHVLLGENGIDAYAWSTDSVVMIPGMRGNAAHFDGMASLGFALFPAQSTSCIVPDAITGSLTVATWARFDAFHDWSTYSLSDIAIMYGTNGGTMGGWGLGATNGCGPATAGFTLTPPTGSARYVRCGATTLAIDRWYFIAGVYDAAAGTADIYVDGELDDGSTANTSAVPAALAASNGECLHLATGTNQMKLLTGALDDVRVYDRALSSGEIAQLYRFVGGT